VSSNGIAAITKEPRNDTFATLNVINNVITDAKQPPVMYQNRLPSSPHVLPLESSALLVSVSRSV
jgi:Leucine-rich repeat (LRR) protein